MVLAVVVWRWSVLLDKDEMWRFYGLLVLQLSSSTDEDQHKTAVREARSTLGFFRGRAEKNEAFPKIAREQIRQIRVAVVGGRVYSSTEGREKDRVSALGSSSCL